jgi:hypothetical protein
MNRTEIVFLLCVFGFAGTISWQSLSQTMRLLPGRSDATSAVVGAAGKARDVDMDRLLPLLRQRSLSEHEAEFYKPVE